MTLRHTRLPIHPRTGLTALGFTRRGPIWPVAGGSESSAEGEGGTDGDSDEGEPGTDNTDGDKPERTFTQADVERLIGERLARERRSKYADYDELKAKAGKYDELEEAKKSETQRLTEALEKAEREANEARTELLRERIARDKKLPPALAARLRGETEEEITADADDLLASLGSARGRSGKGEAGAPDMDQGARSKPPKVTVATGRELFEQRRKEKTNA